MRPLIVKVSIYQTPNDGTCNPVGLLSNRNREKIGITRISINPIKSPFSLMQELYQPIRTKVDVPAIVVSLNMISVRIVFCLSYCLLVSEFWCMYSELGRYFGVKLPTSKIETNFRKKKYALLSGNAQLGRAFKFFEYSSLIV